MLTLFHITFFYILDIHIASNHPPSQHFLHLIDICPNFSLPFTVFSYFSLPSRLTQKYNKDIENRDPTHWGTGSSCSIWAVDREDQRPKNKLILKKIK